MWPSWIFFGNFFWTNEVKTFCAFLFWFSLINVLLSLNFLPPLFKFHDRLKLRENTFILPEFCQPFPTFVLSRWVLASIIAQKQIIPRLTDAAFNLRQVSCNWWLRNERFISISFTYELTSINPWLRSRLVLEYLSAICLVQRRLFFKSLKYCIKNVHTSQNRWSIMCDF